MQAGNQLFAGTAAGALANRGNIALGQVGAFDQAAINRQENLLTFGGFQTDAQFRAAQIALGHFGMQTEIAPTPFQPAQVLPPF